ncbi:MAG: FHA domain-containing protein [bacterium]|nr:FHA domain-containing protein [bacterium]
MRNKSLFLIIGQIVAVLFSSTNVFAVSKAELFIKDHPVKFGFSTFVLPVFIILLYIGLSKIDKLIDIIIKFGQKQHAKEEEDEYGKIPKGLIEEEVALSLSPAELIWRKEGGESETYKLRPNIEFWIGRSEDNELILEDELVSKLHAKIRPQHEGYVLYDIHSYNGTKIKGKKVLKHILKNNDEINIGKQIINFRQKIGKPKNKDAQLGAIKSKEVLVKYIVYAPGQPMLEKQAYAKNISESHICIRTDKYVPETGTTIEMQIQFPNDEVINEILGNVLSCRQTSLKDEYELDIEFSELLEEKQQIISNYIKSRS